MNFISMFLVLAITLLLLAIIIGFFKPEGRENLVVFTGLAGIVTSIIVGVAT